MNARFLAASLAIAAVLTTPATAAAQVELRMAGGRVWLKAVNATVGQILKEWSRLGQTQIVNGDNVPGGPVTLQLDNVSEEQALDVLLKSAAGFMGVRRTTPIAASSEFGRILILPRSSAVPASSPAASVARPVQAPAPVFAQPEPPPSFTPGVQRVLDAQGQPVPDDQEDGPRPPQPAEPPPQPAPYSPEAPFGQPPAQPAGSATPGIPVGVPVPGMTVPAPRPQPQNPPDGP